MIGEVFDNVCTEGGSVATQHNTQTTLVPAGGSAIVEFGVEKPGDLILVDHSSFRAFDKGALGDLHVSGDDNPKVFASFKGLERAHTCCRARLTLREAAEPGGTELLVMQRMLEAAVCVSFAGAWRI